MVLYRVCSWGKFLLSHSFWTKTGNKYLNIQTIFPLKCAIINEYLLVLLAIRDHYFINLVTHNKMSRYESMQIIIRVLFDSNTYSICAYSYSDKPLEEQKKTVCKTILPVWPVLFHIFNLDDNPNYCNHATVYVRVLRLPCEQKICKSKAWTNVRK